MNSLQSKSFIQIWADSMLTKQDYLKDIAGMVKKMWLKTGELDPKSDSYKSAGNKAILKDR